MASGMDWAFEALVKAMGLEPEQVKATIAKTGQIVAEAGDRLTRIEANQRLIMQHLGISHGPEQSPGKPTVDGTAIADGIANATGLANGTGKRTEH